MLIELAKHFFECFSLLGWIFLRYKNVHVYIILKVFLPNFIQFG